MEELIHKLGIEPKILLAQVVNFFILLAILWKLLYKPLETLMAERAERIAKGLENARRMEEERRAFQEERARMMEEAKSEAREILQAAQDRIGALERQSQDETQKHIEHRMAEAKAAIKHQEEQALQSLEGRMVALVTTVASKFLAKKMTAQEDAALIERLFIEQTKTKEE